MFCGCVLRKEKIRQRENRVRLPTQRVKQSTVDKLNRLRASHRGIGKAID